ncbi:MAG: zinc-ribbon domain-containing protein [Actinobacteria bacterium]|nr:MAG: zinc-ribbon domain-containing protein [Actinomycetota bacterium]
MTCAHCGAENREGRKFCSECGTALAVSCPSCGAANEPGEKFCGDCGAALAALAEPPATPERSAERRLVSVLFADLVGFTSASESRDAEDTRELLSSYFDTCRRLIELYGGTVEKFIGDAVMAVWGTPVAKEDDAERAVRAALDLVEAVAALGSEVGVPHLRARAGVLTGEAAVNLAADREGMVAGDLVNTASRIQSIAGSGAVLVGETTKRVTEAAIAYEEAGIHALKGKAEPVELWRALRVIGLRGGTARSSALEPGFVGRNRELRLVKELFHAAAEDRKPHLVSVFGVGGIGKSRLVWEFEKYIDGLADRVLWHRGRCLSYGEGVAFWALAEMVRGRAGILEDEESASAAPKLRAAIEQYVPDPQEQRFVEPRLGLLLGLEEGASGDQENLFAAVRMFFERVAEQGPTVLVFDDIHWADSALLDFVEFVLDWSRDLPLFLLTLARPELADRRPAWGAGKRNFTSISLEPLGREAMEALLSGPVPGLPTELRDRILVRAEGIPFYAVETVRMLLDRGLLVREGHAFRLTGEIETLEVPETLQALIAARLDGLTTDERRLVQDASVLGRTFTVRGLTAVSGQRDAELEPLLASLIRKDILALSSDPMSPERGQYAFLQDLVRKVAYDTLTRKERKTLHLAAAGYLRSLGEEEEVVEVVAAHYLDAYQAAPEEADEVRAQAREMLVRAGERAASLGANAEAQAHFERAAELTDDPIAEAELYERAGAIAHAAARTEDAAAYFERAIALFEAEGASHPAARVSARLAESMWDRGRLEQGLETMDRAFEVLSREEPDADLASLAAQLARFSFFAGNLDLGLQRIETALDMAEALALPEVLSNALQTKALILAARGRENESLALLRCALEKALEHDKPSAALRAYYNLADALGHVDRYEEGAQTVRDGVALARRVGSRYWERSFAGQGYPFFALGAWDELVVMTASLMEEEWSQARPAFSNLLTMGVAVNVHRDAVDAAAELVARLEEMGSSADVQERSSYAGGQARLLLAQGRVEEALRTADGAIEGALTLGVTQEYVKELIVVAIEAALALGDLSRADELVAFVDGLPPGRSPQFLQAHSSRFRARLASTRGDATEADRLFKRAAGLFREIAVPFYLAVTLLEHVEALGEHGQATDAEPLATEAREIFERLGAAPLLQRLDALVKPAEVLA